MSRWQTQFENHPFQQVWKNLKEVMDRLKIDDISVITSVEEVARLNKVLKYISELMDASDPEIVPQSTWQNFHGQCQQCYNEVNSYQSNRNIQHIVNANANADNLLTYVRPYVVESGKAAKAAQSSFRAYKKIISVGLEEFKEQALEYHQEFKEVSNELRDEKIEFDKKFNELSETHEDIELLRKKYFEGVEDEEAIEQRISEMVSTLEKHYLQISEYHTELLDEQGESIKSRIETAHKSSDENSRLIAKLLEEIEEDISELKTFYFDVMGEENDDGEIVGGLKAELKNRNKDLDKFKDDQQVRYKALNGQIEELLPGATSAGLATAYLELKLSFDTPIKNYTNIFYGSLVLLIVSALMSMLDAVYSDKGWFIFTEIKDLTSLSGYLLHKFPIVLPAVWLAIFSSKRRSESQRLQQEYAHKEALAKSYQNFKKQVDELQSAKKEELLERLLLSAIEAVSSNASTTLDHKHGDKTPVQEGFEQTLGTLEKIKKIFG